METPAVTNPAPATSTFDVWTLDVWGNAADGFDVNDRCKVGTVEIPDDADDAGVVDALIAAGYLQPSARGRVEVDGDDMQSSINAPNGRPLLDVWKRPA